MHFANGVKSDYMYSNRPFTLLTWAFNAGNYKET